MSVRIQVTINGQSREAEVEPRTLLVDFLREHLQLTGTHVGCDTSSCGACNVLIDGQSAKSCTMLAAQVDGSEIITVEGLAQNGNLHPIQEGFKEEHGLQCGFCTPGMMMTAVDLLNRNPTRPNRISATPWKATSAAARATTTSYDRCSTPLKRFVNPKKKP